MYLSVTHNLFVMLPLFASMLKSSSPKQKALIKYILNRVAKPSLKAFIYAYLYLVLPKTIGRVLNAIRKNKYDKIYPRIKKTILSALHPCKFPMFSASVVAGINILEPIIYGLLKKNRIGRSPTSNLFMATFVSAMVSAILTFPIYQNHILGYGRYNSLDLTLLLATRAMDTALSSYLTKVVPASVANFGDPLLFIASCTCIMFCWFYYPEKLPPSYHKWITSAANMDIEFWEVLRLIRLKKVVYGEHGPYEDFLGPYFEKHGRDPKLGNMVANQPIVCEAVHAFKTKSCELHALWRFMRGFKFALGVYTPLNLLMLMFPLKTKMTVRLLRAIKSSVRSSSFLGAYIGFYWYAVCLARTRLFPKLFPHIPITRYDDTICAANGAVMCGFSSFIETPQRRKELALFVAPRGLGTLVPLEPTKKNLIIESIVFSLSLAVLLAYSKNNSSSVRGIFGRGLKQVFNI